MHWLGLHGSFNLQSCVWRQGDIHQLEKTFQFWWQAVIPTTSSDTWCSFWFCPEWLGLVPNRRQLKGWLLCVIAVCDDSEMSTLTCSLTMGAYLLPSNLSSEAANPTSSRRLAKIGFSVFAISNLSTKKPNSRFLWILSIPFPRSPAHQRRKRYLFLLPTGTICGFERMMRSGFAMLSPPLELLTTTFVVDCSICSITDPLQT